MELIPVLDLLRGQAVHARAGGRRSDYQPVRSGLAPQAIGDAVALAKACRATLGAQRLYVADLDAIEGGRPQRSLVHQIADAFGGAVLVDAGLQHAHNELEFAASGTARVVVGLESLPSLQPLKAALIGLGPERVTFSLDLRAGQPILQGGLAAEFGGSPTAADVAKKVVGLGVEQLILLDLARVGRDHGIDMRIVSSVRQSADDCELFVGGGIRTWADLEQLSDAGVDAALVATALHDGRIGAREAAQIGARN